jgi:anti-sigma factor RsiW
MSCSNFEQLIALYVGEDLSAVERGRVEAHLRTCSTCWDLAEDLKESQAVFKSIRQDIPNATALSVLRERVLSEVSGLESMTWFERFIFGGLRRKAALASVALIVAGSGALWLERKWQIDELELPPAALGITVPFPQAQPEPVPPPASNPVLRPSAPTIDPLAEEPKQIVIKFLTEEYSLRFCRFPRWLTFVLRLRPLKGRIRLVRSS